MRPQVSLWTCRTSSFFMHSSLLCLSNSDASPSVGSKHWCVSFTHYLQSHSEGTEFAEWVQKTGLQMVSCSFVWSLWSSLRSLHKATCRRLCSICQAYQNDLTQKPDESQLIYLKNWQQDFYLWGSSFQVGSPAFVCTAACEELQQHQGQNSVCCRALQEHLPLMEPCPIFHWRLLLSTMPCTEIQVTYMTLKMLSCMLWVDLRFAACFVIIKIVKFMSTRLCPMRKSVSCPLLFLSPVLEPV